jgi:TonB family protein
VVNGVRAISRLALLALIGSTHAQEVAPENGDPAAVVIESAQSFVPAAVIDRSAPVYPGTELIRGREAWVEVDFCIDESGNPQNIVVLDGTGSEEFERAAVKAVRKWRFEPARADGKPTWQSNNQHLIRFAIDQNLRASSQRTKRQYHKLRNLIDNGDLQEADKLFRQLIDSDQLNLYETAKFWVQRVRYEAKVGDFPRMDLALHRATASGGEWIDKPSYRELLALRVKVALKIADYTGALSAYRKLTDVSGEDSPPVAELQPIVEELRTLVASDAVLGTPAEIRAKGGCYGCDDSYFFTPVRRQIALSDIAGDLRSLSIRCDNRRLESEISEDVEWHMPESWGTCSVQIYGEPGTTFTIRTLPDA